METFRSPRWEDFDYVYRDEEEAAGKRLSIRVAWERMVNCADQRRYWGFGAFFATGLVDIPAEPLPEETKIYKQRPFSH